MAYVFERNYVHRDGRGFARGSQVPEDMEQVSIEYMLADGLIKEVESPESFAQKVVASGDDRRVPPSEEAAAEAPTLDPIPPLSYNPAPKAETPESDADLKTDETLGTNQVQYNAAERPGDMKRTGDRNRVHVDVERLNPDTKPRSK